MTPVSQALEILRCVQIFNGLTETELQFLAERAVPRNYSKGELLFTEGDPCTGLFVIESGRVRIFKSSPNGREQVLAVEGPGSSIAELPLFDGGNYPASTSAMGDARIYFISKQDFHSLCLVHPQVPLKVLKVVGARLRRLVGIIEELSFTTVRSRLISVLVRLAKTGKKTPAGIEIQLPPSNQELASEIGTVRELGVPQPEPLTGRGAYKHGGQNRDHPQSWAIAGGTRNFRIVGCCDKSHRPGPLALLDSQLETSVTEVS